MQKQDVCCGTCRCFAKIIYDTGNFRWVCLNKGSKRYMDDMMFKDTCACWHHTGKRLDKMFGE